MEISEKIRYHRILASYFLVKPFYLDEPQKEKPDIRKVMEQPYQQTCGEKWDALEKTLTDLSFIEAGCVAKMSEVLVDDYSNSLRKEGLPLAGQRIIKEFKDFFKEQSHILQLHPYLTFQQAINQPDASGPSVEAKKVFVAGKVNRPWLELKNKSQYLSPVILTRIIEADYISTCDVSPDGCKILSQSQDNILKVWDSETGASMMELAGHSAWVTCCSFTPGGERIISASADKTIKIWDAKTGSLLMTITGPDTIRSFSISPDGKQIVTCHNNALQVWDLLSGSMINTFAGYFGQPHACAISPDGLSIIVGSDHYPDDRYYLHVLDAKTGVLKKSFEGHSNSINSCFFFPDGRKFVSASYDGTVKIWNLKTGRLEKKLDGHSESVNSCAVSSDGSRIITASQDKSLKLWNATTGKLISTFKGHSGAVVACSFFPDGKRILSASYDQTIKVWDTDINPPDTATDNHINSFILSGTRILTHTCDQFLKVWDSETGEILETYSEHVGPIEAFKRSSGCKRIVTISKTPGAEETILTVWDVETERLISTIRDDREQWSFSISPDGHRVITKGNNDDTLRVWDAESGNLLTDFSVSHYSADYTFFPSGDRILLTYKSNPLKKSRPLQIWDIVTGKLLKTLMEPPGEVSFVSISTDGNRAIAKCRTTDVSIYTINVWDLNSGSILDSFKGDSVRTKWGGSYGSGFVDDQLLIAACIDNKIKLWDIYKGSQLLSLKGQSPFAFFPDGQKIVAANDQNALTIWNISDGSLAGKFKEHTDNITSIAISPGGKEIAVAYYDNSMRLYQVDTLQQLAVFVTESPIFDMNISKSGAIITKDFGNNFYILSPQYNYKDPFTSIFNDGPVQNKSVNGFKQNDEWIKAIKRDTGHIKIREGIKDINPSSSSQHRCPKCGGNGLTKGNLFIAFLFFLVIIYFCVRLLPKSNWWLILVIPVGVFSLFSILTFIVTLFFGRKKCAECGRTLYSLKKDTVGQGQRI